MSSVVGTIARCDLALETTNDPSSQYPMQIHAQIMVRQFEAELQSEHPAIMAATSFHDVNLINRLKGQKTGKSLAIVVDRGHFTEWLDRLVELADGTGTKAALRASPELRLEAFRHIFRRTLDELLNDPRDEGHFLGLYAVARTLESRRGEFTAFAEHLLAFRLAYTTELNLTIRREQQPVNQILTLGKMLEPASLLSTLTIIAYRLPIDFNAEGAQTEYSEGLNRFNLNVNALAEVMRTMKVHRLAWRTFGIDEEEVAATLKHLRVAWQILVAKPSADVELEIPAAMARVGQLTVAWFKPIATVLTGRPALAGTPAFAALMKDPTFADFAKATLLRTRR